MKTGLAVLFLALGVLACRAQDASSPALPSWSDSTQKDWWTKNPTPDTWSKAADALQAQLEAVYTQNGARVFSDSDFQNWLEHLEWIRLGLNYSGEISDPNDLKTFIALGQDAGVSHLLVEKLDPLDFPKQALRNLLRLSEANAADLHEYAALGVAFCVVFDQPFPLGWPHRQVAQDAVPIGDLDIVQRFHFYVQSNRDKKLDLDPTTLSVENLKFLVDSEVKLSELAYAQTNRISYSQFSDAYFSIRYDNDRVKDMASAVYNWPFTSYNLTDIEKNGGICIDQAYYAEMIGKGRGIPTIRFTGYGMDGAHAWFGYLSNSGKWELDCGRYETQDFPKGFAVDPQTWQRIDDATLQNFFKNGGTRNTNYLAEMTALAWAYLYKDDPSYSHILDDAHDIMPEWSGTWRLRADLVEKGGDIDAKKKFYQDWISQFGNYPEMKVEGQKRLYLALKKADDPDADGLLKDIIIQNRSEGFDLGIEASADSMREKLKAENWDDARVVFERAVRDFGQDGGLTLFDKVIDPYVHACLSRGRMDLADSAISFTQDRMTIDPTSQVGDYFKKLQDEVAAQKKSAQ
jgi:hypothetical protein